MYESHWQLDRRPFEDTLEPGFYYPCESHQGALLKLRYVVENRRGCAVLVGATGLGKTLLVHALMRQLPEPFHPQIHLVFPQMPPQQLLVYLADELAGQPASPSTTSIQQSVQRIHRAVAENTRNERHAVVIVDEAHLLADTGALETMRLLLNFEIEGQSGLTLLLVGQPSLLSALDRMPQLEERLGVKCLLRPMTLEETVSYVHHRLNMAGAKRAIFDQPAIEALHHLAQGVPRRVNRLADLALLIGFAEEQDIIQAAHIEAVSDELVSVVPE